ncbi:MAG: DUF1573 domain-containing protein [Planctomycetota bacterium]
MIRVLLVGSIAAALGIGLGYAQSAYQNRDVEERFLVARSTIAQRQGDATAAEILAETRSQGNPKLEIVDGPEYDFGTMMHGTEMSHDFVFKNVGDGPLVLEMGESSCKCTVGELDKSIIQPGEQTNVTLTWKALALIPEFGQNATIITNDVDALDVKLSVFGNVAKSVSTVPDRIQLGSLADDQEVSKTIFIFSYLDEMEILEDSLEWTDDATRKKVGFSTSKITAEEAGIREHMNAKHAYRVDFSLDPGLPIGRLSSRIQYKTTQSDEIGTLEIPVSGSVAGILQLQGGRSFDPLQSLLDLGNISAEEGTEVSLFLFVQGKERNDIQPEIVSVMPDDALQVELLGPRKTSSRDIYNLKFTVPKGAPEAYYPARSAGSQGLVKIKTTGAVEREMKVNIRMVVK